jgi:hypothetical protein
VSENKKLGGGGDMLTYATLSEMDYVKLHNLCVSKVMLFSFLSQGLEPDVRDMKQAWWK